MRWLAVDPIKKAYESPYMAFADNPVWIIDPNGKDTTLPAADGKSITLPTGATFETYSNDDYTIKDTDHKIGTKTGQLRNFTVDGVTYKARWRWNDQSQTSEFLGYQDDNGKSIVKTNTIPYSSFEYNTWLNPGTGSYLNPANSLSLMWAWDSHVRLSSYIAPMNEARGLFEAGKLSANSASIRRFYFLKDARSQLSPLGDFISESPLFNGKSVETARSQVTKAIYSNMDDAAKARKIFNLRPSTTRWARIGRVGGPLLTIATQGYVYYTIIRDNPPLEKLKDDLDTPFNPSYWLYRRTLGRLLENIAQ
jgi:hypothetical protein